MIYKAVISGLTLDTDTNSPIVLLKLIPPQEHLIPIWVGLFEATAIAAVLQGTQFDRPMTHDLLKHFIAHFGSAVDKVEISDITDNTYYAKIYFKTAGGIDEMDARPSDAIALALRFKAPIFVNQKVLDKTVLKDQPVEMADSSEEGQKWADYLNGLNPDDFGKV